ncbi:MAG TPA: FlgD immunoglobulin-like domain containing protein [Candidatus Eisenbacteria bacterium]|nr:FlgD immunoglobulin-like domain containing protein [Candidatus Eisenbacteria bacterium]
MIRCPAMFQAAALASLLLPCAPHPRPASAGTLGPAVLTTTSSVLRGAPSRVPGDVRPVAAPRAPDASTSAASAPHAPRVYQVTAADTIPVYTDNLEALSSPGNEGGWTHVDESGDATGWNISSLYACGSNAFWCGRVDSSWTGDPNRRGYENNWAQTLQNFADLAGAPSPYTISFKHRMNVEAGFDHGYVEVQDNTGDWVTLAQYTGVVNDGGASLCNTTTVTIPDSIVTQASPTRFRFRFLSDLEGSSEDGLYPAGEGWSIDDVTVKGGVFDVRFFDDMEGGLGTWTRSTFPPVGDYWRIALNPVTQQVCTTNPGKAWQPVNNVTGSLVPRQDDVLQSRGIAVSGADQVFLFFDVYRQLSFNSCFYYSVEFRKRTGAAPWSAWANPNGLLYFGTEQEWQRQTVPLAGAAGADSVQFRVRVKDWGPVLCGGSQTASGTNLLLDNFVVGIVGSGGPSLAGVESDLFQDTFRTTAFFGNDNFNTPLGDSAVVQVGAAEGLQAVSFHYSLNQAAFVSSPMTQVGSTNRWFADVPAGAYARGTELRYYFSATDMVNAVATLPADAVPAQHYFRATVLPAIHAVSGGCPDDTARILYVNAVSGPDGSTPIEQSLVAIGARFDRFDVNAPSAALGNTPGGGTPGQPGNQWPAAPVATLGIYRAIVWDTGERTVQTLSAEDQTLLTSWTGLTGRNRGLVLAGDNLAHDLAVNGQGIPNFLSCTVGVSLVRDMWENAPQDSLTPTLTGASGTRLALEAFPLAGGCPTINRFDAVAVSSCVGANGRAWVRYPNTLMAATERMGALGAPGGDSVKVVLLGFSLHAMENAVRRNLLLYRTVAQELEVPGCYAATGIEALAPGAPRAGARLLGAAPNPFNPRTAVRFELDRSSEVRLRIYNVEGALVRTLAGGRFPEGSHRVVWDGRDDRRREVGSGAYFLRLTADGTDLPARKVVLLR